MSNQGEVQTNGASKKATISETSKIRDTLGRFCQGNGLDLGFGKDPINDSAICMDLPQSYAKYSHYPQHLHGDARNLYWFADNSMDYIYSSHLLEDFVNTEKVFDEWARIIKVGGHMVLFCPDEQTYRADCRAKGKPSNPHHIHEDFSLQTIRDILAKRGNDFEIVHEVFPSAIYSFELVLKKKGNDISNNVKLTQSGVKIDENTEDGLYQLSGWAFTDSEEVAQLKVYDSNGEYVGNGFYGHLRPDVQKKYPDEVGGMNTGWNATINKNFLTSQELRIEFYSRTSYLGDQTLSLEGTGLPN